MARLNLAPGERIRRTELHRLYGGRRQGGISPSRVTPNVFVITAATGEAYGYIYDGWSDADVLFHYTGEGREGDQQMAQGNRAIRDHEIEQRDLHLFVAHGVELDYAGQFRYRDDYQADANDLNGELRKVIVFRLEQLAGIRIGPIRTRLDRLGDEAVKEVPIEQSLTERTLISGDREFYEAERKEQRLVRAFAEQLEREGHRVCRLQLLPADEPAPLFCDLFDGTTGTLYEAKGTVTRNAMRMAIGQLADYGRLVAPSPRRVVLMPEKPRPDLLRLAKSQGVDVIWREGDRFVDAPASPGN